MQRITFDALRFRAMQLRVSLFLLALSLAAVPLFAHHGKDFLLVETPEIPEPMTVFGVTSEQFVSSDSDVTFHDEPSVLVGFSSRLAAEIHAHVEREPGASTRIGAIAPSVHLNFYDGGPLQAGLSAEYEIGREGAGNAATLRLIGSRTIGDGALVANVGVTHSHAEGTDPIYAVGYRPDLEARTTWGVEAQGTLRHNFDHEILGAAYFQATSRLTLKLGAGAIVGDGKPERVVRTGLVWHF